MRFVPENVSLTDDAPGWYTEEIAGSEEEGPICWKCSGQKTIKKKICSVCKGIGRLPPKAKATNASENGKITRGRLNTIQMKIPGPLPAAHATGLHKKWVQKVEQATQQRVDVIIENSAADDTEEIPIPPEWIPSRQGEELCNLVGHWRILQRVGSHRWTTDDLCTSYWAFQTVLEKDKAQTVENRNLRYLDLGTGNASVLQMTYWALLTRTGRNVEHLTTVGVEARKEAIELARRSVTYNIGPQNATLINDDFRTFSSRVTDKFDLITGTPPYFRVEFQVDSTTTAIIREGGMPTAKQSAPARCEFRGGIEAYCSAAAKLLSSDGRFVVCENHINHDRTVNAARTAGLAIVSRLDICGRAGKPILFSVYTMVQNSGQDGGTYPTTILSVRDANGNWTKPYQESVLTTMGICW